MKNNNVTKGLVGLLSLINISINENALGYPNYHSQVYQNFYSSCSHLRYTFFKTNSGWGFAFKECLGRRDRFSNDDNQTGEIELTIDRTDFSNESYRFSSTEILNFCGFGQMPEHVEVPRKMIQLNIHNLQGKAPITGFRITYHSNESKTGFKTDYIPVERN